MPRRAAWRGIEGRVFLAVSWQFYSIEFFGYTFTSSGSRGPARVSSCINKPDVSMQIVFCNNFYYISILAFITIKKAAYYDGNS